MRERLEQETGKRTSSEGDNGENLSKVGCSIKPRKSTPLRCSYFQRQLKKLKKQEMRALTKTTEGGVRI